MNDSAYGHGSPTRRPLDLDHRGSDRLRGGDDPRPANKPSPDTDPGPAAIDARPACTDPRPAAATDPRPACTDPRPAAATDPRSACTDPGPAATDPRPAATDPRPARAEEPGLGSKPRRRRAQGSRNPEKLRVYHQADSLVIRVYGLTRMLPFEERFGLSAQMRRAAVSICANIVEGSSRQTRREYARFLDLARGSACELRYLLGLADRLNLLPEHPRSVENDTDHLCRALHTLIQRLVKAYDGGWS